MPHADPLERRIRARLSEIESKGLTRTLRPPSGIDLSSNDYLGLSSHPRIKSRMAEAACQHGSGSTGSRLLRGEREAFSALEQRFAEFKGAERSLYFSSGYMANLAVLSTIPETGDTILSDEFNHASVIDGIRLSHAQRAVFPHLCGASFSLRRASVRQEPPSGQTFLVTESLFSMDGDFAPLNDYRNGATLIVDEAHAVGIFGERGEGLITDALTINPCGKALGVAGAFVAGPSWAIEYLIQRARTFIFSTAAPPAVAAALDASLDVIAEEPHRRDLVRRLARYLRERLIASGFEVALTDSPIVPIILGENARALRVASQLQAEGFDVRAIRPPTVPSSTARLRISVNVNLSEEILDCFVERLCAACS